MARNNHDFLSIGIVGVVALIAIITVLPVGNNHNNQVVTGEATKELSLKADGSFCNDNSECISGTCKVVIGGNPAICIFRHTLQLDGSLCKDNSQCASGVCGIPRWGGSSVCVSARNDRLGVPCRFLENKVGRLSGMYGNDKECSSNLCGVKSLSPLEMACETGRAGRSGSPCGRNNECALARCIKQPGEFVGKCE